jgi:hypothetical protein
VGACQVDGDSRACESCNGLAVEFVGAIVLWVREHLDLVGRDVTHLVELSASIGDPAWLPWWR